MKHRHSEVPFRYFHKRRPAIPLSASAGMPVQGRIFTGGMFKPVYF
jgi:hypothetical protein